MGGGASAASRRGRLDDNETRRRRRAGGVSKRGSPPTGGGMSGCSAQPGPPPWQRAAIGRSPWLAELGWKRPMTSRLTSSTATSVPVTMPRWRSANRIQLPVITISISAANDERHNGQMSQTDDGATAGRLLRSDAERSRGLTLDIAAINERVRAQSSFVDAVKAEVAKVIVGQDVLVERLLIAMLCRGHILIEGVPGLAKTLTVSTLARAIDAAFVRIQFTPDLLPADVTGTTIYSPQDGQFHVRKGPIFANIVLADEINRAPAKVQSALLEAMQERQVSIGGSDVPARRPVHGAGDAEPDRARGHLRAAGGAARPLHAQGARHLPDARRREAHPRPVRRAGRRRRTSSRSPTRTRSSARREALREVHMDDRLRDYIVHLVYATREPESYRMPELQPAHRVRRLAAREHLPGAGGARARLRQRPRLRRAGRREGGRAWTCCGIASSTYEAEARTYAERSCARARRRRGAVSDASSISCRRVLPRRGVRAVHPGDFGARLHPLHRRLETSSVATATTGDPACTSCSYRYVACSRRFYETTVSTRTSTAR